MHFTFFGREARANKTNSDGGKMKWANKVKFSGKMKWANKGKSIPEKDSLKQTIIQSP